MAAGDLISPRVEVYWGESNLTSYLLEGAAQAAPIVYNVTCQLQEGNSNPTGSMEWEPTGPAFKVYEDFIKTKLQEQIVVKFYYLGGRSIPMYFVWAGQTITYGTDMKIVIDLKSELDGMVNATPRSTSSANKDEKSIDKLSQTTNLAKQHNINPELLRLSDTAKKDMSEASIKAMHTTNQTYAEAVNNLVQSNGNVIFPNSIGGPNMSVHTPWSYKGEAKTVLQEPKPDQVDPKVRYGYLLGPSMYSTIERKYQWTPPQQTNTNQPGGKAKPTKGKKKNQSSVTTVDPATGTKTVVTTSAPVGGYQDVTTKTTRKEGGKTITTEETKTVPANTRNAESSAVGGTGAPGASQGRINPGIRNDEDKVGTEKQKLLNDENAAKISVNTFMIPALTGIKPGDVMYIPSLGSSPDLFMEDWVVRGVTYTQTDGGVTLSIEGSRWFGNSELMQKDPAKPWIEKALKLNADPTLAKWQEYAWSLQGLPPESAPVATSTQPALPVPATPAQQAEAEFSTTRTANVA